MGGFRRVKAALIGSGAISGNYLRNISSKFHVVELVGCSDLLPERSAARAEEFGIRQMTNEEILSHPEIEIVINTTYPLSHYEVSKAALIAGKHVYTEKMLAVTLEEGRELVELAESKGLLFTAAPDTFLGGGWQTARFLVDSGAIGEIVSLYGVCVRSYQDHSDTCADPKGFVFSGGGGIPFDMGGYYLHNMINLAGPIRRVGGFLQTRRQTRSYTNPRHPKYREAFTADSPNSMAASLEFVGGALGTLLVTSEASVFGAPRFEVQGTLGNLILFDPNDYGPSELGGPLQIATSAGTSNRNNRGFAEMAPQNVPLLFPFTEENRGIGVADMAYALLNGRKPRVSAELGYHAFEAVHGIWRSCKDNSLYTMKSICQRPAPLVRKEMLDGTAYESILDD